jgi:hypothetical protein
LVALAAYDGQVQASGESHRFVIHTLIHHCLWLCDLMYFLWYTPTGMLAMAAERAPRKIELVFFRNNAGGEPVREWLKGLDEAERRAIGTDLLRAQWRWPVGMPLDGQRFVGGANESAQQSDGARVDLSLS